MATYSANVTWTRDPADAFTDNRYPRRHRWTFDGGAVVPGSSSPHSVRVPLSDPTAVDPEEAFVASLSSCHMLWFLSLAAAKGYVVDSYIDDAVGTMARDAHGKMAMTDVRLRPAVRFSTSAAPGTSEFEALHLAAHDECYIANSVLTVVTCTPTMQ